MGHGDGFGVSAEDEKAAEDEGKKQMQAELEEEKAEADKESKELDEEKKKSEAELGKEMGDLAKKIKNETAAEEEDLKEQNATATKLRQQEELTELNEVKTGMDKLAKEDAKVNEERTEEGIQDKKVLAKQAAQKAKMEKDMGAAKAKFAP